MGMPPYPIRTTTENNNNNNDNGSNDNDNDKDDDIEQTVSAAFVRIPTSFNIYQQGFVLDEKKEKKSMQRKAPSWKIINNTQMANLSQSSEYVLLFPSSFSFPPSSSSSSYSAS